ncbi:MAG: hypothetical protein QOJ92_1717 [Frankiales bacterium]|nr:hypothetical protein [Frankiales bacterium]
MRRLLLAILLAPIFVGSPARADECHRDVCPVVDPGDGGVDVGGTTPSPGPGQGNGGGASNGKHYQYSYVPTCWTNGPENPDALCMGAIMSCQARGETGIQMWVFRREVTPAGVPISGWDLVNTVCTNAYTPTSPAAVRTLLLTDSKFIPAPRSQTRINPSNGRTVVNAEVVFSADTPPSYSVDVPILGFTVHLDLEPKHWDWHFGDGQSTGSETAGRPYPAKDIVHRYRTKGAFAPYVTVTWGGTFTFNGVVYPINGTTTVDGPPSAITIAEAKGHLVGGPNG